MNPLFDEALCVHNLIPWVHTTDDIINFMTNVSENKRDIRCQLALRHFFKLKDASIPNLNGFIENEAHEIIDVLPNHSLLDIRDRLKILGNVPNRKEIILRQLLYEEKNDHAKRCNGYAEYQGKVKIRKLDGTYRIVNSTNSSECCSNERKFDDSEISGGWDQYSTTPSTLSVRSGPIVDANASRIIPSSSSLSNTFETNDNDDDSDNRLILPESTTSETCYDSNSELRLSPIWNLCDTYCPHDDLMPSQSTTIETTSGVNTSNELSSQSTLIIDDNNESKNVATFSSQSTILVEDTNENDVTEIKENDEATSDSSSIVYLPPDEHNYNDWTPDDDPFFDDIFNYVKEKDNVPNNAALMGTFPPPAEQVDSSSAAGPSTSDSKEPKNLDMKLVIRVCEMFPATCPNYIKIISNGRSWHDLDKIIEIILNNPDHPKRPEKVPSPPPPIDPEQQFEVVKAVLPDADPTYLRISCENLKYDPEKISVFIEQARESRNYPTMKEYLRKQQLSAQSKQYTTEFKVENFVELFPDPEKTFNDPKRSVDLDPYSTICVKRFFENRYNKLHKKFIHKVLGNCNYKICQTDVELRKALEAKMVMKSQRKKLENTDLPLQNIPLLQEFAYLIHKNEIEEFLKENEQKLERERQFAKSNSLMKTCECCYDEEVMPKDVFYCPQNHLFCRDCIKKSCEVRMGEARTDFTCLMDCTEEFALNTLQNALPPKMFSKLAQKKALAEIKAAGLEELETCPFCDFASIPNVEDRIFRCLNPDCMKESCRQCREPSHIPLRCDEIEKDENVRARTHIENKMTEALIRKCWKCGTSFYKEEGCNKMTCTCGASMCYICGKPVTDYKHFNGMGGDKYHLCPLYSDTNEFNKKNVIAAAQAAKAEVGTSQLKVDPSENIEKHFNKTKNPNNIPFMINIQNAFNVGVMRNRGLGNRRRRHYPMAHHDFLREMNEILNEELAREARRRNNAHGN